MPYHLATPALEGFRFYLAGGLWSSAIVADRASSTSIINQPAFAFQPTPLLGLVALQVLVFAGAGAVHLLPPAERFAAHDTIPFVGHSNPALCLN